MTGDNPQHLVILVDAVVNAFLQEVVNKEHKRRLERLDQLKELYNIYEDTLRRKRQTLRDFAQSAGSADAKTLALKHRFAIEQLAMAEKELMELQSQLRKLQVEATDQQGKEKTVGDLTVPEAIIAEHINADPVIRQHLDQMAGLDLKLDQFKQRALEPNKEPAYRKTLAELEATRTALAARRKEIRPRIIQELREKIHDDLRTGVVQLRARGGLLKEHEKVLNDLVDRLRKETISINQKGLTLDSLQDDIPRGENLVKTVGNELDALNVELQAPPRVTLLEAAGMGQTDTRKRKFMAAGAAGAGTLLVVLLAIAFWEFRWRRVNTVDEVVHGLGVNLIGAVPRLPYRAQRSVAASRGPRQFYWQNLLVESVNTIRTMLLHTATVDPLRMVMVTSALGGEGKTSLSSQLAISLARAGRKTLLVDGDLRRASVHRVFGVPLSPGFSEVLCAEVDLPDAIQAGPVSDLWILAAGRSTNEALEAMAQPVVPALFQRLREQFDFILIDSCPVLPVADSLLLGQHVDGVIFALLREVSRLPQVYAGYQRLASLGIRMLGIVVNGAGGDVYGSTYSEYQYLDRSPA
jgi:capsular exopolysaccharide synthesis family protein